MAAIADRRSSRSRSTWWPRSPAIPTTSGLPISGIGGIETWRDAVEFMALGAGTVQVCTAVMHYGFRIVDGYDRRACPPGWTRRAMRASMTSVGKATPRMTEWQHLNLDYVVKARIDQDLCIKCGRCHIGCEDTSHQAITSTQGRQAPFRGDRGGMRRLQPLRRGMPGRELHHHGAARRRRDRPPHGTEGRRPPHLARAPQQPLGEGPPACEIRGRIAGAAALSPAPAPAPRQGWIAARPRKNPGGEACAR